MSPKARAHTFENCENFATLLPSVGCLQSAWMYFPWACRTISRSRLKKDRLVCGWALRFSERDPRLNHRGHGGKLGYEISGLCMRVFTLPNRRSRDIENGNSTS